MFKKRKLISIMLTVSMMLTLFPFASFAEEGAQAGAEQTQQEEVATQLPAADDNGVITLEKDVALTSAEGSTNQFPTEGTVDLNGHHLTVTLHNDGNDGILIQSGKTLTIKDSSVAAPNKGGTLELKGKNRCSVLS